MTEKVTFPEIKPDGKLTLEQKLLEIRRAVGNPTTAWSSRITGSRHSTWETA